MRGGDEGGAACVGRLAGAARWGAGVAIAGAVGGAGVLAGDAADWSGLGRERAALAAVAAREARAARELATLRVQPRATAARIDKPEGRGAGGRVLRFAAHAQACGLQLRELGRAPAVGDLGAARGAADGGADERFRLVATGGFGAIRDFLAGLTAWSELVVPAVVEVRHDGAANRLETRLDVFAGLASPPVSAEPGGGASDGRGDPFVDASFTDDASSGSGPARLVGVLRDARRGLALFERDGAAWSVAAGERVGDERVAGIDLGGVTLSARGASRRVPLREEAAG